MNKRVIIDPAICHGKPVIEGTEVLVSAVLGSLAAGMKDAEIQRQFDLGPMDIYAALRFAQVLVEREELKALTPSNQILLEMAAMPEHTPPPSWWDDQDNPFESDTPKPG